MGFNRPLSQISQCLRPCGRFAAQAGAVTATSSLASSSMGKWNKRRLALSRQADDWLSNPYQKWTNRLIAVNVAVFLADTLLFTRRLLAWSSPGSGLIRKPWQWWKLLTPSIIHSEPLSLLCSMLALYSWGPELENMCGSERLWDTYVVSAAASNATALFSPTITFGASGACMGIISAITMHLYRHSSKESFQESAQAAGVWWLFGLLSGRFWSMLGGGIAGAVVANSWEGRKPKRRPLRFRVVHRRVYTGRSGPAAF
ncbi:hypothetical protein ABBQ38_012782 [Trebouxia sp. C0009 RCD-2024]